MELANRSMDQHKQILGQCNNEYNWDAITSTMLIQLDTVHHHHRGMAEPRRDRGRLQNTYLGSVVDEAA
eukprot:11958763-Heterocapsa_arctica.AAC.1